MYSIKIHQYQCLYFRSGLPHAHILVTLEKEYIPHTPDDVDKIISAELPDPEVNPVLYKRVLDHMVNGPCGPLYPNSRCMVQVIFPPLFSIPFFLILYQEGDSTVKKCEKNFPVAFQEKTRISEYGVLEHRRRSPADPLPSSQV